MASKPEQSTNPPQMDHLSQLQKRLNELGEMLYSHIGVIQRDAPPLERPPDEAEEIPNDSAARKQLESAIPEYAREIIQCSRDIDKIIDEIDTNINIHAGKERPLLDTANFESMQAGDELNDAVDDAQKLLTSVRDLISAREVDP